MNLYFPRFVGTSDKAAQREYGPVPRAGDGEVILVVEDNEDVRNYSVMILSELGYEVLEAHDAESALRTMKSVDRVDRVDLLFTDVVLPGKTGRATRSFITDGWMRACS